MENVIKSRFNKFYKSFKKNMDDDLDPKDKELEDVDVEEIDGLDDDLILGGGKKSSKKSAHDDDTESLEDLAEIEEGLPDEDSYDDVDHL